MVRATRALAAAENTRTATAYRRAVVERSLVSLVEEVYAVEFDLALCNDDRLCRERAVTPTERKIRALAAEFIASLNASGGDFADADGVSLTASMLLGGKFDALSSALSRAGFLRDSDSQRDGLGG